MKTFRRWWCMWRHSKHWRFARVSRGGDLAEVECGFCDGRYLTHRWHGGLIPWTPDAERFFGGRKAA